MKKHLILLSFLLQITVLFNVLLFSSCKSSIKNQAPQINPNDCVFYNNKHYKFSLNIPKEFEYSDSFKGTALVIIRIQKEKPVPTNLTLTIVEGVNTDLDTYYKYNVSLLKKEMPEEKIVLEKKIKISKYVCYITDTESLKNNKKGHNRLYTFLESKKGFHFALISNENDFEKAKNDFEKILETLIIE